MYSQVLSRGDETKKCQYRVIPFIHGNWLDLGPGNCKVAPSCIGIGLGDRAADIHLDLSHPHALGMFASNYFDGVYSSHMLEDVIDTVGVLKQWWRVIKPGGYLILYGPHKDLYPRMGQPGANIQHKRDMDGDDVLSALREAGASYDLIRHDVHNEEDEYSFEIICQKRNCQGK